MARRSCSRSPDPARRPTSWRRSLPTFLRRAAVKLPRFRGRFISIRRGSTGAFQVSGIRAPGRPLALWIDGRMPRPSLGEALQIATMIVDALDAMHARGFVHCDVSPRNLLYDPEGRAIYFADSAWMRGSGTARRAHSPPPTPFSAPEQTLDQERQIDGRTDFYATGIVLHQLVTGQVLADGAEVAFAVARDDLMPAGLAAILGALLHPNPSNRYATASALKRDLARCLEGWRSGGVIPELAPNLEEPGAGRTLPRRARRPRSAPQRAPRLCHRCDPRCPDTRVAHRRGRRWKVDGSRRPAASGTRDGGAGPRRRMEPV